MYLRCRIHHALAASVAFAVMLLHIADLRIFPDEKAMQSVMRTVSSATIMDTTSRHDRDIAVLSDIEIVVHHLFHATLRENNRNMNTLILRSRLDDNVDAGLVRLADDINICSGVTLAALSIHTDIVCSYRKRI